MHKSGSFKIYPDSADSLNGQEPLALRQPDPSVTTTKFPHSDQQDMLFLISLDLQILEEYKNDKLLYDILQKHTTKSDSPYMLTSSLEQSTDSLQQEEGLSLKNVTCANIQKIMSFIEEQKVNLSDIHDRELKKFAILFKGWKIINSTSDSDYYDKVHQIHDIFSLMKEEDLDYKVQFKIMINLIKVMFEMKLQPDIQDFVKSLYSELKPKEIILILNKKVNDPLYADYLFRFNLEILHAMSPDKFAELMTYINQHINDSNHFHDINSIYKIISATLVKKCYKMNYDLIYELFLKDNVCNISKKIEKIGEYCPKLAKMKNLTALQRKLAEYAVRWLYA